MSEKQQVSLDDVLDGFKDIYEEWRVLKAKEERVSSLRLPDFEAAMANRKKLVDAIRDEGWMVGYCVAISNAINGHGAGVENWEAFRAIGKVNPKVLDEHDFKTLLKAGYITKTGDVPDRPISKTDL